MSERQTPHFNYRRRARLHAYRKEAGELAERERIAPEDEWETMDSPLRSFALDFSALISTPEERNLALRNVFPGGYGRMLTNFLEETIGKGSIGVELGGTGSKLFRDLRQMSPNLFVKTAAVTPVDYRERLSLMQSDPDLISRDTLELHYVIEGNVLSLSARRKVRVWAGERKVDFCISRMLRALEDIPRDPVFIARNVAAWYELLSEKGVMLLQIPDFMKSVHTLPNGSFQSFSYYVENWVKALCKNYPGLEVKYDEGNHILIRKLLGAPQHLPLLASTRWSKLQEIKGDP